jgi:hypothetical protein
VAAPLGCGLSAEKVVGAWRFQNAGCVSGVSHVEVVQWWTWVEGGAVWIWETKNQKTTEMNARIVALLLGNKKKKK